MCVSGQVPWLLLVVQVAKEEREERQQSPPTGQSMHKSWGRGEGESEEAAFEKAAPDTEGALAVDTVGPRAGGAGVRHPLANRSAGD